MRMFRFVALCWLLTVSCFAQVTSGRVVGTVVDATGAAISGAEVSLTNQRTAEARKTSSAGDGSYVFTVVPPSDYVLHVKAQGFAETEIKNLTVLVGQELTRELRLTAGGTESTVTVTSDDQVALETSSAKVGVNVTEREVAQLPLNGRQVSQLYLLAPGAVNSGGGAYDNIRFSGRSNQQNIIRVDGIENTSIIDASPGNLNGETTSNFRLQQSLEFIQEFRVDSSNYPAEQGTGTGGQISFVTKSGTNRLHGSAFEYLRNNYFDARNTFVSGNTSDKLRLNQFGGSLGGPILKDKLFFFGVYEGLRQRTAVPYVEGTLSAYARSIAAPSIRPLLAAFPVGTIRTAPSAGDPNPLLDTAVVLGPNSIDENFGGLRLDYKISDRFNLYARYNRDQGLSSQTQNSTLSLYNQSVVPQNGVLGWNQVWTPTLVNETKFGFNGVKERVAGVPGPSPNANLTGVALNLTGGTALSGIAGQTGAAGVALPGGLIRLSSSFNGRGAPYTNTSYSFIDNLSKIVGNHSMKFGVEIRPVTLFNDQQGGTTYSFNSITDFLNNNTASIQYNGDLSALSPFTGLSGVAKLRQNYYIGFAQDEWKARRNLTISYGLRYEYYEPLRETRNKNVFFDIPSGNIIPKYTGDWYHSSVLNFGPRLSIQWAPDGMAGKTVFRAGGGYYFGPGQTEDQLQPEANDRIGTTVSSGALLRYPLDTPTLVANYNINSPTLGFQPRAYAPNYKIPEKILGYSLSVQQELPGSMVATVAYVGSQGRNLFLRSITNLITGVTQNATTGAGTAVRQFGPRFAEIDYKTSGGSDGYNSLQTTLSRKAARGLSLGAQYTWAHSIGTSAGSNEANTAQNPYDFSTERGRNNFDVRHSLNVTTLYELPFGRGKQFGGNMNRSLDLVAGGWQMGGILNFRSGVPIDVLITRPDLAYVGNAGTPYAGRVYSSPIVTGGVVQTRAVVNVPGGGASRNVRRPNVVTGVNTYMRSGRLLLNPAAFSVPAPGTFGNFRRNDLTGPNLGQLDITMGKNFHVTERAGLEFRAEFYNILNHPNFANPGTVRLNQGLPTSATATGIQPGAAFTGALAGQTASAGFGTLTSTVSNQVGLGTNRQMQFSLRATF